MSSRITGARRGDDAPATLVRPLGALERLYHRYMERLPMHFVLAAQFDTRLDERQVKAALAAVQGRHPLLSVHVEDHVDTWLGFYRAASVPPIELTVLAQPAGDWQPVAAQQLARPFDRSSAPLMRAVLIAEPARSTLLLTFDHVVADPASATIVLGDLVAALNGAQLEPLPVPPSQEEKIAATLPSVEELALEPPPTGDPRMAAPGAARRFDGTQPHIHAVSLDSATTARLVERCRAERTTVHAAIVAVASRVRSRLRGEEFVRVITPFSLRTMIGPGDDCVDCVLSARTGMAPLDGASVWDQARNISLELASATSTGGVVGASAAIQQFIAVDANSDAAEAFLIGGFSYEMVIDNLGVRTIDSGPIRPRGLWGPMVLCQVDGEYVTGTVTYDGELRMATCGYTPTDAFLDEVRAALLTVSN